MCTCSRISLMNLQHQLVLWNIIVDGIHIWLIDWKDCIQVICKKKCYLKWLKMIYLQSLSFIAWLICIRKILWSNLFIDTTKVMSHASYWIIFIQPIKLFQLHFNFSVDIRCNAFHISICEETIYMHVVKWQFPNLHKG